ncbi:hypothetical protein AYI69_g5474 [Smittium culicis]|uniref:Uncharacterized protein n=1 Tax=Smittium culicis TaxID=133412 RepID=A0A1R1Y5T2_9FUNG|nr:hypothetical protein AYI69_g5474 [Smittium culicis]
MPNSNTFNDTKTIIIDKYNNTSNKIVLEEDAYNDCNYYILGKINPVKGNVTREDMDVLENELEIPTGEKTINAPKISAQFMLFSDNCNSILTTVDDKNIQPPRSLKGLR